MTAPTTADAITLFVLNEADVRGRVVRLGQVATTILSRYDYPPMVATLLGELLVVAAMLSANLKQEGIFTIQLRGKGLIPLLVVDAEFGGKLRGFAEVSEEAKAAMKALREPTLRALFGDDAYFAITLDPGAGMQRYQGVVALEGDTVADILQHYFTHSQQVEVLFRLGVAKQEQGWVAGGLMVERLPPEHAAPGVDDPDKEPWRYASAIAATVKENELTDPLLDAATLLYRLYHEEGVWISEPQGVSTGCRCSRQRIHDLLMSMPLIDRADMIVDGYASVHCQFCNTTQKFAPSELGISAVQ